MASGSAAIVGTLLVPPGTYTAGEFVDLGIVGSAACRFTFFRWHVYNEHVKGKYAFEKIDA